MGVFYQYDYAEITKNIHPCNPSLSKKLSTFKADGILKDMTSYQRLGYNSLM